MTCHHHYRCGRQLCRSQALDMLCYCHQSSLGVFSSRRSISWLHSTILPFIPILHLMSSLNNIQGFRKVEAKIGRRARVSPPTSPTPHLSSLPPHEDLRSFSFESNGSFVSIQGMKWERWAGARAALGTCYCSSQAAETSVVPSTRLKLLPDVQL